MREAFGDFGWEPQEFVDLGDHVSWRRGSSPRDAAAASRWKR
jgi:hypothetical protein